MGRVTWEWERLDMELQLNIPLCPLKNEDRQGNPSDVLSCSSSGNLSFVSNPPGDVPVSAWCSVLDLPAVYSSIAVFELGAGL